MTSFLIYNLMFFFSTAFIWLKNHIRGKAPAVLLSSFAFFILFIPTALRYGVGTDFFSYYNIYNHPELHSRIEAGFASVNSILRYFNLSAQWGMAAYAFIFFYVSIRSYPKKSSWVFHVLFISSLLFFSFNGIRQSIAVAFISLSILFFINKEVLKSITYTIIGGFFHKSAFIILPIIILYRLPINNHIKTKITPIFVILIVLASIAMGPLAFSSLEHAVHYFNIPYSHYFNSSYFEKRHINTGILLILKTTSISILLFYTRRIISLNERYWIIIIITFFYLLFYSLSYHSAVFGRLSYVFIIGPIYIIYICLVYSKKSANTQLITAAAAFFLFFAPFALSTFSAETKPNSDTKYKTFIEYNTE